MSKYRTERKVLRGEELIEAIIYILNYNEYEHTEKKYDEIRNAVLNENLDNSNIVELAFTYLFEDNDIIGQKIEGDWVVTENKAYLDDRLFFFDTKRYMKDGNLCETEMVYVLEESIVKPITDIDYYQNLVNEAQKNVDKLKQQLDAAVKILDTFTIELDKWKIRKKGNDEKSL